MLSDENDRLLRNRYGCGGRRRGRAEFGMRFADFLFEVSRRDLIEGTGRNFRGDAQRLREGQDFLVVQAEPFRDVVNAYGHI